MPVGVIIDALSVLFGGLLGSVFGKKLSAGLKESLTLMFGLCALAMGINSVILVKNLPVIILSLICGTAIGVSFKLESKVSNCLSSLRKPLKKFIKTDGIDEEEFMRGIVTIIVLFCASANGIYGSLDSGFSGDHTILISKAIMDFFTAMIFACNYGSVVSMISLPQFVIYLFIFVFARFLFPLTNATMVADFKGCGGLLMLATGFRLLKTKQFPLVDMIPSLIIVMPLSYLWTTFIIPLL